MALAGSLVGVVIDVHFAAVSVIVFA